MYGVPLSLCLSLYTWVLTCLLLVDATQCNALGRLVHFQDIPDKSLQAYALRLPDSSTLGEEMDVIEPDALYKALG